MLDIVALGVAAALIALLIASVVSLRGGRFDEVQKRFFYGPVVFGLIGCACGVSTAMLFRYDVQRDRVDIHESVPLAVAGLVVGAIVGRFVKWFHRRFAHLRGSVEVFATALLLASVGTVLGWLSGDKREGNPPTAMIWGLFGGLVLGTGFGVLSLILDYRRQQISPRSTSS
jgi:prepilin signal peptidase PulO-like enzyme (type II secretory pathway)